MPSSNPIMPSCLIDFQRARNKRDADLWRLRQYYVLMRRGGFETDWPSELAGLGEDGQRRAEEEAAKQGPLSDEALAELRLLSAE